MMRIDEKDQIHDFICKEKFKFITHNPTLRELKFKEFLIKHNIKIPIENIDIKSVFEFLSLHWDKKCEYNGCNNNKRFNGLFPQRKLKLGYSKFCSDKCEYKYRSEIQSGIKNTCHRQTAETHASMKRKQSIKMKENIRLGLFVPAITNSWCRSLCSILIMGELKKVRSCWEAYFYILNPNLEFEKVVIPYKYENGETHNYLIDFVDIKNKILYEIKPSRSIEKNSNHFKLKVSATNKWCKKNKFEYKIISDGWFFDNYDPLKIVDQPLETKDKMIKNLKQFLR